MIADGNRGLCITCRHYVHEGGGMEFEGILDTEYVEFRCEVFGKRRTEHFLMEPVSEEISTPERNLCEFWEFWDREA